MQNEASQAETVDSQLQEVDDEQQFKAALSRSKSDIHTESNSDAGYTKKVMEDLDALLADLQSTTANISSYQAGQQPPQQPPPPPQQQQQQQQYFQRQYSNPYSEPYEDFNSGGARNNGNYNGSSNIHHQQQQPPYPNNRYNNGVVNYNQQPQHSTGIYRQVGGGYHDQGQGHSRDPGGVVTVKRVSYGSSDDGGGHSGSSTPPPLPPPPPSEVLDSLALAGGGVGPDELDGPVYQQQNYSGGGGGSGGGVIHRQGSAKGRGERMSALSNNLSELDQLLQDLNSAQFMAEVDRKSSNIIKVLNYLEDQNEAEAEGQPLGHGVNEVTTVVNGGPGGRSPAVAPKPVRAAPPQRTSVDNLLDELEAAAPQPGRFPVDPIDPHYQELSTVSTQYHQQQQRLPQQQQQQHSHHQHLQTGNNGSPYLPASSSSTSSSSSYHHPQTASTATKELDELMNSLSEFKLQNTDEIDPEPAYAKPMKSRTASGASPTIPQGSGAFPPQMQQQNQQQGTRENGQLESMLGDLQSDMNRQGVNTKQKGVCAACQKPIVGQVIAALGKTWHVEHFVCAHCEEPLGTRNFYERDSLAYCETDYHHLFAPRCAYCNGPIVDKCIEALNKMWHPEHFFCAQCGRPFGEDDFHEKNGQAYCREDYFAMFAPKCGGCALPIMENYISALNRQWHPECFVCWQSPVTDINVLPLASCDNSCFSTNHFPDLYGEMPDVHMSVRKDCRAPFGAGSFFDYEGLPYCETHYHAKKGSLCASCEKPITGRCITAMFKKFHPEHFVCAFCLKQLNKGTFKEQNDKPYCHPCFVKLFG